LEVILRRLFGTDGVRGVANRDLTPELVFKIGFAGAEVIAGRSSRHRILLARDTRPSGYMLEDALSSGLCSAGADVFKAGILSTPAVSYLTRTQSFDAGVMISASHNPVEDNGIKFISNNGMKLSDDIEEQIEEIIDSDLNTFKRPAGTDVGKFYDYPDAIHIYSNYLLSIFDGDLNGMRISLDCANGSAANIAPALFSRLGAEVQAHNVDLGGSEINKDCGSTYPQTIQRITVEDGSDIGLTFDGDADRCLLVDRNGKLLDGDHILAMSALYFKKKGMLAGDVVISTEMANMGLEIALGGKQISLIRTRVGDRYVLEEMLKVGSNLGGEQSGHIIFLDRAITGDGLITALEVLRIMRETGQDLKELGSVLTKFPQKIVNVRVEHRDEVIENDDFRGLISRYSDILSGRGRIVVRKSGTEPVIRIMVESEDLNKTEEIADKIYSMAIDIDKNIKR
jgi:phosphoglucosamine mutase